MRQTGHRGRVDGNHAEIVAGLREIGFGVQSLAKVGDGVPDLLVSYRDLNCLIEVKDSAQPNSKQKLSQLQREWLAKWPGQAGIARDLTEAVQIVTQHAKRMGVL